MQIDRSNRPSSSGELKFNPPNIDSFILKNGLKVFFCRKSELPIIRINFLVNSGSRFDPNDKKGLSNLLAMCIDEGAGQLNALQLAEEFEMLGANFSVSCDSDFIILTLQILNENFTPALNILKDVIVQPHLKEEDFAREKHKVLVRLNQSKAEPDFIADVSFEYFLFGKNSAYAFPTIGIEETVQNLRHDSIREVYEKMFSPLESKLVIVGDFNQQDLRNLLDMEFDSWNVKSETQSFINKLSTDHNKIIIINKAGSVQTELRVGHLSSPRNQQDYFQKQIINLILGGQFSSRLNLNLREKNGFTYGVHSSFNYLKDAGYFAVSTSVDTENTANALKEIYYEIDVIKNGITNEELQFAKSTLTKKFPSYFESYRQIAANISTKIIHNLPDDYFETYVDNISAITLADVNKIAVQSIHYDRLITVLVGDADKIVSQLNNNKFSEVEVMEFDEVFKR